jgi:excisionase family DNA binding protein
MYTIKQVCEKLGISRSLCYREIQHGNLRAHRFARRTYRVSEQDLAEYVSSSAVSDSGATPTAKPAAVEAERGRTAFRHIDVSRWLSSQS